MIVQRNIPETFKVTHEENNVWRLHSNTEPLDFDNIISLAKSIKTNANKFRIPPLDYDKSQFLLICLPQDQLKAKKTIDDLNSMNDKKPEIIDAEKELIFNRDSLKISKDGVFSQLRSDWKLPGDKKIEVTLKILNKLDFLPEILKLANMWSRINAPEILKLYGVSLYRPTAMILESTKFGQFNEFLRRKTNSIKSFMLIDAAYSLAKALHYLQENKLIHTKIRCSSLQVVKFTPNMNLVVKLGDPGLEKLYTFEELVYYYFSIFIVLN